MNKVYLRLISISILIFVFQSAHTQNDINPAYYEATDPAIYIMGRTQVNAGNEVEFDWSGVEIHVKFTGTSCAIKMNDSGKNFYNVFVDQMNARVVEVHSDTILSLATGLKKGQHILKMTKRTEGNQGKGTFKGILLDSKGKLLPVAANFTRKIEFIGNSITCGYGSESKNISDPFRPETENNYKSYAPITARAFNAESHIIAHSGQGVVRNYGYKEPISDYTMPDRFIQVFDTQKEPVWDFSSWKPDLLVINLGTNDYSTQPQPDELAFTGGYKALINTIRNKYGSLPIFCLVGPMTNEPCYSYVKKMVEEFRTKQHDSNVYFIGIPNYLLAEDDWGAYHPTYSGQLKMAAHVVPVISSVMGWEYGEIK